MNPEFMEDECYIANIKFLQPQPETFWLFKPRDLWKSTRDFLDWIIKSIFNKKTSIYLYSILDNNLKELQITE